MTDAEFEEMKVKIKAEIDVSVSLRKQLIDTMLFVRGPHSLRGYLEQAFTSGAYITRDIADAVAQSTLDQLLIELLALDTAPKVEA